MSVKRQEDVMREFIEIYKTYSCLWKVKSAEYMDKYKKEEAYQLLVETLKQINPDANSDVVKKKINSMRSCFRKEYKKVLDSRRSGTGSDDIYTPTLWYFELLMFLKDQEMPRSSIGSDNSELITRLTQGENDNDSNDEEDTQNTSTLDMPTTPSSISSKASREASTISRKSKKRKVDGDSLLQIVGEKLQNSRPEDEFDIVGRNVAEKLRSLDPNMRIFAEKLINDTFFEARLGTLNRYAYITIPQSSQPLQSTILPQHSTVAQPYFNIQSLDSPSCSSSSTGQYFAQFPSE